MNKPIDIEISAKIKVIGCGGSGKGALNHMISSNLTGIEFIAMNTDTQDLHNCLAKRKVHLGKNLTKGLGAGMDPEIGKKSAEESREEIKECVKDTDILFIACGMGGGTATGAAPVIAQIAKEEGVLTIAIVTKPFFFEGQRRNKIAEQGLLELEKNVDALIVIPNDRLLSIIDKNTSVKESFKIVDDVLKQAIEGVSNIIQSSGTINLDFADIKRILKDSGTAIIGIGKAEGANKAVEAAKMAINSPLLGLSINGAKGLLYAIYGNEELSMFEVTEAANIIVQNVDKDAVIMFGIINDESLKADEVKIVVIATQFPINEKSKNESVNKKIEDYKNLYEKEKVNNNKINNEEMRNPEINHNDINVLDNVYEEFNISNKDNTKIIEEKVQNEINTNPKDIEED